MRCQRREELAHVPSWTATVSFKCILHKQGMVHLSHRKESETDHGKRVFCTAGVAEGEEDESRSHQPGLNLSASPGAVRSGGLPRGGGSWWR